MADWQNQIRNMMGVPSAVFPSVAQAFYPSYYTPQYGANPFSAAASGFRSLSTSPNPTVQPGQYTGSSGPVDVPTDPNNYVQPGTYTSPVYPDNPGFSLGGGTP